MCYIKRSLASIFFAAIASVAIAQTPESMPRQPRVVITADPELDDNNTLIRAILYTTDFNLEGLVYVSSGVHWRGDGKGSTQYIAGREYTRLGLCQTGCTSWRWPAPQDEKFIDTIVDTYTKVYPNLKENDPHYPSPSNLKSKIFWGNVDFDGDYSKDTDGSNLIKRLLLDNEPGPLYVTAQGGQSTIARALKSIYDQYHATPQWDSVRSKISHKLIIIPFGDQDGTYASYIKPNWPEVQNWQLAMINFGYGIRGGLMPEDKVYISAAWNRENILSKGPLGVLYRVWGDGKRMVANDPTDYFGESGFTTEQLRAKGYSPWTPPQEKDTFISEGDTPTFMNLLNNGLRAYESGSWGGWGGVVGNGAQTRGRGPIKIYGPDDSGIGFGIAAAGVTNPSAPGTATTLPASVQNRAQGSPSGTGGFGGLRAIPPQTAAVNAAFFAAAQNDFAARLKWSVTPHYKDANHAPIVSVKGPLHLTARAGETVHLNGQASDPDHNNVAIRWWQYNDAGTYKGTVQIADANSLRTTFHIPQDAKPGETIHIILEGTDNGVPALTRYERVVVTVE